MAIAGGFLSDNRVAARISELAQAAPQGVAQVALREFAAVLSFVETSPFPSAQLVRLMETLGQEGANANQLTEAELQMDPELERFLHRTMEHYERCGDSEHASVLRALYLMLQARHDWAYEFSPLGRTLCKLIFAADLTPVLETIPTDARSSLLYCLDLCARAAEEQLALILAENLRVLFAMVSGNAAPLTPRAQLIMRMIWRGEFREARSVIATIPMPIQADLSIALIEKALACGDARMVQLVRDDLTPLIAQDPVRCAALQEALRPRPSLSKEQP